MSILPLYLVKIDLISHKLPKGIIDEFFLQSSLIQHKYASDVICWLIPHTKKKKATD